MTFWQNAKPFVDTDPDHNSGRRFAKVRLLEPPPEMIHVLAAEIIYHLRSSLDQIAVRLAMMSGVSKPNLSKIYFPVGGNAKGLVLDARGESRPRHQRRTVGKPGLKRRQGEIERLDPDLIKLVLRQKAYPGGDDDLYSIFPLANIDKHAELIPTSHTAQITAVKNFTIHNAVVGILITQENNLQEGIPFSELGADGVVIPNNPQSNITISGQITFGNTKICDGDPVVMVLDRLISRVERFVTSVTDHCIRTGRIAPPQFRISASFGMVYTADLST